MRTTTCTYTEHELNFNCKHSLVATSEKYISIQLIEAALIIFRWSLNKVQTKACRSSKSCIVCSSRKINILTPNKDGVKFQGGGGFCFKSQIIKEEYEASVYQNFQWGEGV